METTFEDNAREMVEFQAWQARRKVKGSYALATLGATTECGGEVVSATAPAVIKGRQLACVGDLVRYPDGRETTIVSGAGAALSVDGKPVALVGSFLANGDMIVASPQDSAFIREYADDLLPGLFEVGYRTAPGAPGALMCRGNRT